MHDRLCLAAQGAASINVLRRFFFRLDLARLALQMAAVF
jgi:hypothetical protein